MIKLSKRLSAAAGLVKKGSVVADIGTDHGYVPVYLVKSEIVKSAIACDINEKPLETCKTLVKSERLEDKIDVRLSNGLEAIKKGECDTVIIAGMGGELIADILSKCDFLQDIHIILQPMTHPELARKFLYNNGYGISNDFIVSDAGHFYNVFDARYTGVKRNATLKDCFFGNINDFSEKEYFIHLLNYLKNKSKSGVDLSDVINAVEEKL